VSLKNLRKDQWYFYEKFREEKPLYLLPVKQNSSQNILNICSDIPLGAAPCSEGRWCRKSQFPD